VQHERGPRNSTLRRQMSLFFKESTSPPSTDTHGASSPSSSSSPSPYSINSLISTPKPNKRKRQLSVAVKTPDSTPPRSPVEQQRSPRDELRNSPTSTTAELEPNSHSSSSPMFRAPPLPFSQFMLPPFGTNGGTSDNNGGLLAFGSNFHSHGREAENALEKMMVMGRPPFSHPMFTVPPMMNVSFGFKLSLTDR